jgi:hypothetical protein
MLLTEMSKLVARFRRLVVGREQEPSLRVVSRYRRSAPAAISTPWAPLSRVSLGIGEIIAVMLAGGKSVRGPRQGDEGRAPAHRGGRAVRAMAQPRVALETTELRRCGRR